MVQNPNITHNEDISFAFKSIIYKVMNEARTQLFSHWNNRKGSGSNLGEQSILENKKYDYRIKG